MSERSYFCIRGYMKSGTNWVCRLLNQHPDVHSSGEFHWHRYLETYLKNNRVFQNIAQQEAEDAFIRRDLEALFLRTMDHLAPANAKFVGDRTPHKLHPIVIRKAPHISVVRDCRDIIVSRMFHYFNLPDISNYFQRKPEREKIRQCFVDDPWFFHKHPEKLLHDEAFVRQTSRQWREFLNKDRHTVECHSNLPVRVVKYESLHANLEEEVLELVSFIGADPEKMPPVPKYLFPGHKKEQPNSFNRKGVVGDWRNYITEDVVKWINAEAGDELIRQNYVDSLDWFKAPAQQSAA